MSAPAKFFRIQIGTLNCTGEAAYVAQTKPHLAIVNRPELAEVFPEPAARNLIARIAVIFKDATLCPATFDEWIEAEPKGSA